jgi:hypothetical protein
MLDSKKRKQESRRRVGLIIIDGPAFEALDPGGAIDGAMASDSESGDDVTEEE